MAKKTVLTRNGKYYKIDVFSSGKHKVYSSKSYLCEVKSLEDAIAVIKSDSGSDIQRIS